MRWRTRRRSQNVEDRRGTRISRRATGGGLGVIVLALAAIYFGVDPSIVLQGIPSGSVPTTQAQPKNRSPEEDQLAEFISVVLADTEDTWHAIFREGGTSYTEPTLVLFSGAEYRTVISKCAILSARQGLNDY